MNAALLNVAWRSAWNRRFTLALTVCSIALSTFMLLGVERIRTDLRDNFTSAVSGTDLIVGARTGSAQLLLYAVFRMRERPPTTSAGTAWRCCGSSAASPG